MRLNFFLSLSLLLLSKFSFAQISVKGTLYEKGTKELVKNTNVYILPHKLKATTNEKGQFIFPDVPKGEFQFVVNKAGYLRLEKNSNPDDQNFELFLEREFYDVFETVVTGKEIKKDVTKKTLTQKQFLKAPGAQEDPVKAVENLPGVANQNFGAQIVIQGSEADDTRYSINGHEIPLIFHFGGLTSVVTPRSVEEVEFLAAGFGPEYGRATGGIINLKTKAPRDDRWRGEGFLDITKLGVMADGPINEKSQLLLSSRVSYFGKILEKAAEEMDDFGVTSAPEFQDYFLNYNYKISEKQEFNLIAIASKDTLELIVKEGQNPIIEGDISNSTSFNRVIPRYIHKFSDNVKLDFSVGYGRDELNFNLAERFFDLEVDVITNRTELEHKVSRDLTFFYGTDIQWRRFDLNIFLPDNTSSGGVNSLGSKDKLARLEGENIDSAAYIRTVYKYNDKLTLSPNLRYEYFSTTDKYYFMPRINTSYSLSNSIILNFATGTYYQSPQNGENSEEFGNPSVISEKAIHYFTSIEKDFREGASNGLTLELGFFYKDLTDLIVNTSETLDNGTPIRNTNRGDGTVEGIQLQAEFDYNEYKLVTSYTYLKSRREDPENGKYPSRFDQTHNLNLIGVYERTRWSFSTRVRYVSGGPYTPIVDSVFDSDNSVYLPKRGNFFSERFDDFFQLDFRVDRKFVYDKWILSAYLDIQNLTNQNNGQGISYNYNYRESEKAAGTPIIPIFGLRGEF